MHLLSAVFLAGFVAAAPAPAIVQTPATPSGLTITGNPQSVPNRNYTLDEIHNNIMGKYPSEDIITSAELHKYFLANVGSNHTIYISDHQKFVSMTSVKPLANNKTDNKRQTADSCFGYTNTYTIQATSYWDEWKPAGYDPVCLETGNSNDGGSQSLSWAMTTTLTETGGLDWNVIVDVLSASLSFSVSESWTESSTTTCLVQANSVVQVWETTYLGWGHFNSQSCQSCDYGSYCDGAYDSGTAAAPQADHYSLGCSTGWANVVGCA